MKKLAIALASLPAVIAASCSFQPTPPAAPATHASPASPLAPRPSPTLEPSKTPSATPLACPPINAGDFPPWVIPTPPIDAHQASSPSQILGLVYQGEFPIGTFQSGKAILDEGLLIDYITMEDHRYLLLSREVCLGFFQLLDVLDFSDHSYSEALFYAGCTLDGEHEDPGLVAIVHTARTITEAWPNVNPLGGPADAFRAWRVSTQAGRFESIRPDGITCDNAGEGYSYPWDTP